MQRYCVTYLLPNGLRTLVGPAQARHLHHDRKGAETWLRAFLAVNAQDRIRAVYGGSALGTFRVDSVECWENGDPKGIYFD